MHLRHTILFAVLCSVGCFQSHPIGDDDACPLRDCFAVDAIGCCSEPMRVSACELCPTGTVEQSACRVSGCGTPTCEFPLECRQDFGDGCCGAAVFNESCAICPGGSVSARECVADYPDECGCDDTIRPLVPPGCYADLGGGCCDYGIMVPLNSCGLCPAGSLGEFECTFAGGPPMDTCFEDLGDGCCGAPTMTNACGFCAPGNLSEEECAAMAGAPMDDEADPAPGRPIDPEEPPRPECRVDLRDMRDGLCGCVVDEELNACGECPAGSTLDCTIINCPMP